MNRDPWPRDMPEEFEQAYFRAMKLGSGVMEYANLMLDMREVDGMGAANAYNLWRRRVTKPPSANETARYAWKQKRLRRGR